VLVVATLVAVLLRTAFVQPFSVPSAAMVPTLQAGDRILVVTSRLLTGPIKRGDIVVFRHPSRFGCGPDSHDIQNVVKRVIGLPGETIWSVGNAIDVDGRILNEPGWYNATDGQVGPTPILRTTIPRGDYYVLGDNRTASCDSRSFGPIAGSSIVGKVVLIVTRNGHPYLHIF
jgi:signal peptidase I